MSDIRDNYPNGECPDCGEPIPSDADFLNDPEGQDCENCGHVFYSETQIDDALPPPDPSWKEILKETDWELLRKQKETLIRVSDFNDIKDDMNGIINFLDHIQDAAAEEIGEETVFGDTCSECGEPTKPFMKDDGTNLEEVTGCPDCDS